MNCTYGPTLLKIDNVCLDYSGKVVLKDVNITIEDIIVPGRTVGQVVGFIGPSGIGKTSLFRIIAGLAQPSSGRIILNGFDRSVKAGEVGVVAQTYPLFDHRTVLGNLMLAASKKEKDDKVARDKVMEYAAEFELTKVLSFHPAKLSGGQRQRAAIIQQILCSQHFLLMDEPFSGLDMVMLEKTSALIRKIADKDDLNTIILVTHDITSAAAVSDHLWMMGRDRDDKGEVIPGARIVETYNLIERDLAWQPDVVTSQRFVEFVREVKARFRTL
jgi:ABC-type nitrate/sulfonate/bicarbonate transport system ATPase subunit